MKKLLFVLRDFDDRDENADELMQKLLSDMEAVWESIYKPEKFANTKPKDFFQFDFCLMPNKVWLEEAFIEKAHELKARFKVSAKDSLFLSDAEQKNVPIDGLPIYIEKSWEMIRDQKELNLPDQREMVANYRC